MTSLPIVAAVYVGHPHHRHAPTVRSLLRAGVERVVVGGAQPAELAELQFDDRVEIVYSEHVADLVNDTSERFGCCVVACDQPVVVSPDALTPTVELLASDMRIPTVSYWCNAAGYLSFPEWNLPTGPNPGDLDEVSGTARMRQRGPLASPVCIPLARGPLVAISRMAVTACGPLVRDPFDDLSATVAEFGLRAASRGFTPMLDPTTLVVRPYDLGEVESSPIDRPDGRTWLHERHPVFPVLYDRLLADPESPVAQALSLARAQATGLRVLIDARAIGPFETGTQVQILCTVRALAARADVRSIVVTLPGPIPPYATEVLATSKVSAVFSTDAMFPDDVGADIVHRPYQPDSPLPLDHWQQVARRVVITVQDLIAYRNGTYHSTTDGWLAYRHAMEQSTRAADAVVVIADDVREAIALERLGVEPARIGLAYAGTDHLHHDEPAAAPAPFLDGAMASRRFLLVLGTTYMHKNRDLAIRAWRELRRRGHDHALVVVGAHVPFGSSRHLEALALGTDDDDIVDLLAVSSEERNWLLRHADVVVYPTSAEGFGLVPFEAAAFGTPCVSVRFGPLAEVRHGTAGVARSWDPDDLADAVGALLDDPDAAEAAVGDARADGTALTWDSTAAMLVDIYRNALASSPTRRQPTVPAR